MQGAAQHKGAEPEMATITLTTANELRREEQLELKYVSVFCKYKALCRH